MGVSRSILRARRNADGGRDSRSARGVRSRHPARRPREHLLVCRARAGDRHRSGHRHRRHALRGRRMPRERRVRAVADSMGRSRVSQHARGTARLPERPSSRDPEIVRSIAAVAAAPSRACGRRRSRTRLDCRNQLPARRYHLYLSAMNRLLRSAALLIIVVMGMSPAALAKGKQAQPQKEPDLCAVPPGAQPLLPAKLLPGMGSTKDFPVTTSSELARKFFLQGISQIHSFWFTESERSCLQALEYDPNMAMAHWCIALSAAGDYRPAFQLLRNTNNTNAARGNAAPADNTGDTVVRTANGAAVNPQIRAREAIGKAMALRDTVTDREKLYIEAMSARRAPGNKDAADAG